VAENIALYNGKVIGELISLHIPVSFRLFLRRYPTVGARAAGSGAKIADGTPERGTKLWEPTGPEQYEHHHQNDEQFAWSHAFHANPS
jgi:hypothetical protein